MAAFLPECGLAVLSVMQHSGGIAGETCLHVGDGIGNEEW